MRGTAMTYWLPVAAVVAGPAIAYADPVEPVAEDDVIHSPGFVAIDRFDGTSRVGAETSYAFAQDGTPAAMRADAHLQYVDPKGGLGAYAVLPISHVSGGPFGSA